MECVGGESAHAAGAGHVRALTACAPGPWQLEAVGWGRWYRVVFQSNPPLYVAGRDFVVIAKPFPLRFSGLTHSATTGSCITGGSAETIGTVDVLKGHSA